jgi:hypothetical protein
MARCSSGFSSSGDLTPAQTYSRWRSTSDEGTIFTCGARGAQILGSVLSEGRALPGAAHWSLYELADRLRDRGWQVPAYPCPRLIGSPRSPDSSRRRDGAGFHH